jgi:hypothetical protein
MLHEIFMQITQPSTQSFQTSTSTSRRHSPSGAGEIHAYIAARDGLLAQAERLSTFEAIHSVAVANDVVRRCLRPVRPVYSAQHLPEAEAARERERCNRVAKRLVELQAKIG